MNWGADSKIVVLISLIMHIVYTMAVKVDC